MKFLLNYFIIAITTIYVLKAQGHDAMDVPNRTSSSTSLPELKIGDQLPNFYIPKILNTSIKGVRTSDFKDRLLILDFWSIYCSGCVEALPKMNALQNLFKNKIKILPITHESAELVSKFWKKNKYTRELNLPYIVEDTIFSSYFRHQTIPHEVWIYKNKIVAITTGQYVDSTNIQKVLNENEIVWPVKNDFYQFNGKEQSLFKLVENLTATNKTRYAAIQGYRDSTNSEGLTGGSGIVKDSVRKTIRVYFLNQPIYTAYYLQWENIKRSEALIKPSPFGIAPNEVLWEVNDKSKYYYDPKVAYQAEWIRKHSICFESLHPDTMQTKSQISMSVITDLNVLLNLRVRWEKRKEKVFVLIKRKHAELPKANKSEKISLSTLIYNLNKPGKNPYFFEGTGYSNKKEFTLKISDWTNINAIRKELIKCGIDLKEENREVDKFVFTELPAK